MGGSGGSSGGFPVSTHAIQVKIAQARAEEKERLNSDVDHLLRTFLAQVNDRDAEATRKRLDVVVEALSEVADIETLLFGGSVAKHTFVDGLSDVDALVVLRRSETQGLSPQGVLKDMQAQLAEALSYSDVKSIDCGTLAVTVRFKNGTELQLLPAVRSGTSVTIPNASGMGWTPTNPSTFRNTLTRENNRLNRALVPTVKLVKSLVGDLPKQQQISGYHAEALCVDAVKGLSGSPHPRELLIHVLDHASRRVMTPIRDVTGQSRSVDESLGPADSSHRRLVSQALGGIKRRPESATSINQWRALFGRKGE